MRRIRKVWLGLVLCIFAVMAPMSVQAKTVNAKTYSLKDVRKAPQAGALLRAGDIILKRRH